MKLHQLFKSTVAALACAGMLVPSGVVEAAEASAKRAKAINPATVIRDVELTKEGSFHGQVLNAKKEGSNGVVISIRHDRKEVKRAKSDAQGRFAVTGLKPGIYYVVAGTGHGLYRVWKEGTAPPKALKTARIISDKTLVRGLHPHNEDPTGQILYDDNGVAYGQVRIVDTGGLVPVSPGAAFAPSTGFLDSLGVYDLLLLGTAGAGLGFGIAGLNEANDNNDNTNNTP